jgi:hypothetical protein
MTAEYVVAPVSVDDSTATSRTAFGIRASAFASCLPHPQVRTAVIITRHRDL